MFEQLIAKMKDILSHGIHDWKTTITGIAVIMTLWFFANGQLDEHQLLILVAALSGLGLTFSSDTRKPKKTDAPKADKP